MASVQVLNSTGSTFNRGDFTATGAFFWSSINLAPYAGQTRYSIVLTDGAAKTATGYIGAVGAGETLSTEKIMTWTNNPSYPYETFDGSVPPNITSAINTTGIGNVGTNAISAINKLFLVVTIVTLNSGANPSMYDGASFFVGSGSLNKYWTNSGSAGWQYEVNAASNFSAICSIKQVTDPPSTGVHIVSAYGGSVRAWASIDSGFDPNTITTWVINENRPTGSIFL